VIERNVTFTNCKIIKRSALKVAILACLFSYATISSFTAQKDHYRDDSYWAQAIVTECQFHQHSTSNFTLEDLESTKRQSSCQSFLDFWNLRSQRPLLEGWWNWPQEWALWIEVSKRASLHIQLLFSNQEKR